MSDTFDYVGQHRQVGQNGQVKPRSQSTSQLKHPQQPQSPPGAPLSPLRRAPSHRLDPNPPSLGSSSPELLRTPPDELVPTHWPQRSNPQAQARTSNGADQSALAQLPTVEEWGDPTPKTWQVKLRLTDATNGQSCPSHDFGQLTR